MVTLAIRGKLVTFNDEDTDLVYSYPWNVIKGRSTWYALVPQVGKRPVWMHRLIMGIVDDPKNWVDHMDKNGLNNCRDNLRLCNPMQNGAGQRKRDNTTSKYKGVSWYAVGGTWQAHVYPNRTSIYLGRYPTQEEAALAYDEAARMYYGEFAQLNFPE